MSAQQEAALEQAAAGRKVFLLHSVLANGECSCSNRQCKDTGKHPRIKDWENEASTDAKQIVEWWTWRPQGNIGMPAGANGFVVLDVDPRHGGDDSLAELEGKYGPLPETWQCQTGSGGLHIFFALPASGPEVRNTTQLAGLPGLDVRGAGGYVVAAGSHNANGPYCWEIAHHPDDTPLAPLPTWLLGLMLLGGSKDKQAKAPGWIADLLRELAPGNRNDSLTRSAGWLHRYGAAQDDIVLLLSPHAARCGLETDEQGHIRELEHIAESVTRYKRPSVHSKPVAKEVICVL